MSVKLTMNAVVKSIVTTTNAQPLVASVVRELNVLAFKIIGLFVNVQLATLEVR
jgi:hypothetical protein